MTYDFYNAPALQMHPRIAAHEAFDPIWKNGYLSRNLAYKLLARAFDLTPEDCHIKTFDAKRCAQVIEWSLAMRAVLERRYD